MKRFLRSLPLPTHAPWLLPALALAGCEPTHPEVPCADETCEARPTVESRLATPVTSGPSGVHGGGFQNVVAASPVQPGLVLSGADVAGIHRSTDWGATWQTSNLGLSTLNVASIAFSQATPGKVYVGAGHAGNGGGLFVSMDSAQSWSLRSSAVRFSGGNNKNVEGLPDTHPRSTGQLILLDEAAGHLYVGTFADGVKRSDDDGRTWTALGPASGHVYGISRSGTTVYAATYEGGVYVCNGADVSTSASCFVPLTGGGVAPPLRAMEMRVFEGALWVAAGNQGVYRYVLGTRTWEKVAVPAGYHYLSLDGFRADGRAVLYLGTMKAEGGTGTVILRSINGGPFVDIIHPDHVHATIGGPTGEYWWHYPDAGHLPGDDSFVAAHLEALPGRLMVAGRGGLWHTTEPEVASATPDWYPLVKHLEVTINPSVATDPTRPGRVYVGNMDWTFFVSSDRGATVKRNRPAGSATVGLGVATDPSNGDVYLAAGERDTNTHGEVYVSDDPLAAGGAGWRATGLAAKAANKKPLDVVARGGTVIAAVNGSGIWRKVGAGEWAQVNTTAMPERLGTGSGFSWAPSSPTVYLCDEQTGVWRSNSAGAVGTWTHLWNFPTSERGTCHALAESASRLWVSTTGGLFLLEGANSGTVGNGVTPVRKAATLVTNAGPLVKAGAYVYVVDQVKPGNTSGLFRTLDGNTFEDVTDAAFRRTVHTASELAVDGNTLYVALNGTGLLRVTLP
jgi:hypothetical protein